MTAISAGNATLIVLLLVVVAVLIAGSILGQPVLLSYVETESMEPTLEPGDGFVAIPAEVAGPVEEGDVVTFEAQQLHGGGLTTHRVVGTTEHGYVTKGDANPVTDQSGNEPHVTDGQIVAKALQIDGRVVVIPHLGTGVVGVQSALETAQFQLARLLGTTAVLGTQGLAYVLFAFGVSFLVVSSLLERGTRTRAGRSRTRSRKDVYDVGAVVIAFALLVAVATVGTMVVASGSHEYGIVSAEFDSDRPDVIPTGETERLDYTLHSGGVLPMVTVVEPASEGIEVEPREHHLTHNGTSNVTLSITAPPETGYYLRSVSEYRYFAVLPPSIVVALHGMHPWLAIGAVTAVVVGAFTLPLVLLIGTDGRIRVRERRRKSKSGLL